MTIKQQGGIFGRNPTFNDVDVEGTLTIGGSPIPAPASTLVSSDIGVTVQGYDVDTAKLDVAQTFTAAQTFNNDVTLTGTSAAIRLTLANTSGGTNATFAVTENTGVTLNLNEGATARQLIIQQGGTEVWRLNTSGNLAAANGKGIDFSATAGTGTSELFDDYEEGNWTPSQGGGLTVVGAFASSGTYTKIGRQVSVIGEVTGATSIAFSSGGAILTGGLPFNAATYGAGQAFNGALSAGMIISAAGGASIYGAGTISANSRISFQLTYFV